MWFSIFSSVCLHVISSLDENGMYTSEYLLIGCMKNVLIVLVEYFNIKWDGTFKCTARRWSALEDQIMCVNVYYFSRFRNDCSSLFSLNQWCFFQCANYEPVVIQWCPSSIIFGQRTTSLESLRNNERATSSALRHSSSWIVILSFWFECSSFDENPRNPSADTEHH